MRGARRVGKVRGWGEEAGVGAYRNIQSFGYRCTLTRPNVSTFSPSNWPTRTTSLAERESDGNRQCHIYRYIIL